MLSGQSCDRLQRWEGSHVRRNVSENPSRRSGRSVSTCIGLRCPVLRQAPEASGRASHTAALCYPWLGATKNWRLAALMGSFVARLSVHRAALPRINGAKCIHCQGPPLAHSLRCPVLDHYDSRAPLDRVNQVKRIFSCFLGGHLMNGAFLRGVVEFGNWLTSLAWNTDGETLAAGCDDGKLHVLTPGRP